MNKSVIPFGLQFAVYANHSRVDNITISYDPDKGYSLTTDEQGQSIPFVTLGYSVLTATQTGTVTKAKDDSEDVD